MKVKKTDSNVDLKISEGKSINMLHQCIYIYIYTSKTDAILFLALLVKISNDDRNIFLEN